MIQFLTYRYIKFSLANKPRLYYKNAWSTKREITGTLQMCDTVNPAMESLIVSTAKSFLDVLLIFAVIAALVNRLGIVLVPFL